MSPFSRANWNKTFETVEKDLGYRGYIDFLRDKKGRKELKRLVSICQNFLDETSNTYARLVGDCFFILPEPAGPGDRSRFDAIYLLGLSYLDRVYPDAWKGDRGAERVMKFLTPFCQGQTDFLIRIMGFDQEYAKVIATLQILKFITLARRYGTKSIIDENFLHLEEEAAS